MIYSKKTNVARRTRVLALTPAVALGLALLSVPTVSEAMTSASTSKMNVSPVSGSDVTTCSADEQTAANDTVFLIAEKLPEFEGGINKLMSFISNKIIYPKDAMELDIQGSVTVQFTVAKDGSVRDVIVTRSVHSSLDEEAIRVVKATSGKWIPGEDKGEKVNVRLTMPISFKLTTTTLKQYNEEKSGQPNQNK